MNEAMAPYYYDELIETKYIRQATKKLLDVFFYELKRLEQNQYILTADESGIGELEKQLDILPDATVEDLEFRRQRVLNRHTTKPPFTLEYLQDKLDQLLGDGSYEVVMDYSGYAMDIELGLDDAQLYKEIALTIGSIKPANILEHLTWIRQLEKATVYLGAALQIGSEMSIYPIFNDELEAEYTMPIAIYYNQGTYLSVYPKE